MKLLPHLKIYPPTDLTMENVTSKGDFGLVFYFILFVSFLLTLFYCYLFYHLFQERWMIQQLGLPLVLCIALETDSKTVTKKVTEVGISNGLAWSLDYKTMYYIDSTLQRVDAFDYDVETGNIANRRTVIENPKDFGIPDGMTIDSEGKLWVALWEGSAITRWDPTNGKLLLKIALPAKRITSASFGGEDLSELYVTSAAKGEPYPNGALFRITNLGVKGVSEPQFGL